MGDFNEGVEDWQGCLEMYIRLRSMASMIMVGNCDETLLYVCSLLPSMHWEDSKANRISFMAGSGAHGKGIANQGSLRLHV
jgi:hypothetical protein